MSAPFAHLLLPGIIALSILLMLLRPRNIPEAYWVGGGVLLLLALHLIPLRLAGRALAAGTDVYLFLIGMMLLSELAQQTGIFDWLSSFAVRRAHGSRARLFTLVYAIGAAVTIFLSNDATAVVLTPAVLAAVRKARVPPLPYLFTCALIANAASFVLPISNPANLVVFRQGMPPLSRWLLAFGLPSLLSIAVTYAVLRVLFRRELLGHIAGEPHPHPQPLPLSGDARLVLVSLALLVTLLLLASQHRLALGLPTCLAALAISAVLALRNRTSPLPLLRGISWGTLILVASLFILVDAAETAGALQLTRSWLAAAQALRPTLAAMQVGAVVAVANNLVNNLPLGLLAGATLHTTHTTPLLTSAVLIGVDLGPNLSITGSLATILWLIALRRESLDVSFLSFLKVGIVAMPLALLASLAGALLTHLLWF